MGWMTIPQSSHLPESTPIIRNAHMSHIWGCLWYLSNLRGSQPKKYFLVCVLSKIFTRNHGHVSPQRSRFPEKNHPIRGWSDEKMDVQAWKALGQPTDPLVLWFKLETSFWDVFGFQHEIILILMWNVEAKVKEMNKFSNPSNLSRSPY